MVLRYPGWGVDFCVSKPLYLLTNPRMSRDESHYEITADPPSFSQVLPDCWWRSPKPRSSRTVSKTRNTLSEVPTWSNFLLLIPPSLVFSTSSNLSLFSMEDNESGTFSSGFWSNNDVCVFDGGELASCWRSAGGTVMWSIPAKDMISSTEVRLAARTLVGSDCWE